MKILTLTTSYPIDQSDWRGSFVADLGHALEDRGHEVITVTPGPGSLYHADGIVETLLRRPWLSAQLPAGLGRLAVGALRERHRCDAILSHWLIPCGWLGARLKRGTDIPHVAIVHGGGLRLLDSLPEPLARRVLSGIADGTDRIQAVAPWIADRLGALHPPLVGRIDVDPMGVTPSAARAQPPSPPPLRVLYVGRLVRRKGVATLLEAISAVPDASVTIVGDGPERAHLEAMARPHGDRVRFLGELSPSQVAGIQSEHHVIAAPSLPYASGSEGTPTAVLTAMGAGLVPVASRTGGLADLLADEESGVLVPPGDADALAGALRRLAASTEGLVARAQRAHEQAARHAWPQVAARVEARLVFARSRVA